MATEAFGEERQVKLLGAPESPFVLRVCIALALKGINYQLIPENMQNKSELLVQSNPVHMKVPVLIHNGKPVCESMIIVQYIDEKWDTKGPNFMPKDPYDRAIARFWAAFVDDKANYIRWHQLVPCIRGVFCGQGEPLQKAAEEFVTNILLIEEALKTSSCFSGKPYFGGDEIGFLDIALGGFLASFLKALQKATDTVLIDPEIMPLLSAWIDRFCEYDTVKEVVPDPAKQLETLSVARATYLASLSAGN